MHEQHRERMRQRFYKEGFDHFETHELLEVLLYYSRPRGNTNPSAHELLEHFGSLKRIFEASVEELTEVRGIGERSATLIKLIPELLRRYAEDIDGVEERFDTLGKAGRFLFRRFLGLDHERLYMMMFNNRMNLIDCVAIADGTVNSASVPVGVIVEKAIRKKASAVILAHNHPNGIAVPSPEDNDMTETAMIALNNVGIDLIEHVIVADGWFTPILRKKNSEGRTLSQKTALTDGNFFERFYDIPDDQCCFSLIFPPRNQE